MRYKFGLVRCNRNCAEYKAIRDRHYIPNHGAVGQQMHYLICMKDDVIGIISGGASAYSVKCRDDYFGITKDNRDVALNGIVDNTVFRLEMNLPNLGTQILRAWRKQVAIDWQKKYGVRVAGFETFIIENERRKGALYKADNWQFVGVTSGSSKFHSNGIENPQKRVQTVQKLVFCKRIDGVSLPTVYFSNWKTPNIVRGQISFFEGGGGAIE